MDKNMINIDDLLKQRLSGGEEKERPGAWFAMRELLDDNMPTRVAGGFNWRRMFTILTGAALLTAATVGGYKMYSSYISNTTNKTIASNTINNATPVQSSINTAGANNSFQNSNNNSNNNHIAAAATAGSSKSKSADSRSYAAHVASNKNIGSAATASVIKASKKADTKQLADNVQPKKIHAATKANELIINKYSQYIQSTTSNSAKTTVANNTGNSHSTDAVTLPSSGNNPIAANSNVNNLNSAVASSVMNNTGIANNSSNVNVASDNVANKATKGKTQQTDKVSLKKAKLSKDSINMVAMKESYSRKKGFRVDTIDQGKVAKNVADMPDDKLIPAANSDLMASAATAKKENKEGTLLPLSQFKVSSKKTKGWNESRFEEMVKNAKFDFSKVSFYPGIVFGVATSFGENSVGGFQVGFAGNTVLSDHWSILTELKFRQDFNLSGNVIQDNYYNNGPTPENNGPVAGIQRYHWDSVDHSFTFTTLSSVHLPIAVKYSIQRLNMFFGADLGYNFAVNYTEPASTPHRVTQDIPVDQGHITEMLRYYNFTHDKPSITPDAFSPRLGIGALLGISYNITPATSLDLRYSQNVWDSRQLQTESGASTISDKIFNRPTLQFNISYRFSSNRYRVKTYKH